MSDWIDAFAKKIIQKATKEEPLLGDELLLLALNHINETQDFEGSEKAAFLIAEVYLQYKRYDLTFPMTDNANACQSPIEEAFFYGFLLAMNSGWGNARIMESSTRKYDLDEDAPLKISITPQYQIGKYTADFLIRGHMASLDNATGKWSEVVMGQIVVECDGHDFHEKTKKQAAHDKKRDRALQDCGYQVYRFAGSEIWKDPTACALQVINRILEITKAHESERGW